MHQILALIILIGFTKIAECFFRSISQQTQQKKFNFRRRQSKAISRKRVNFFQEMAMTSFQSGYVSTPQFSHDGSHMHAGMVSAAPQASAVPQPITAQEAIEVAGRNIEKMIHGDSQFASLADKLRLGKVYVFACLWRMIFKIVFQF